ncbi:MAG: isoamylase early set domain-containing protein [Gemmatimonadaceae bacterium]
MSDELNPLDPNVEWIVTEARRPVAVDPDARRRLLDAVRGEPVPHRRSPVVAWFLEPRHVALPPIATVALAAGLVGIGVITGFAFNRDGRGSTEQPRAVAAVSQLPDSIAPRAVRFVLIAPQAARVSVVGDFNGWDSDATPAVRQPDGAWTTYVPLRPGRHVYSFIVDGKHIVNDPAAPIVPDDGYGQKNVMLVVAGASS